MIKEDVLVKDIRQVFVNCEKYFQHDPNSIRICKILKQHFEVELAAAPNLKF